MGMAGLHPRLTVLQAAPHERPSLTEHLARLCPHVFDGAIEDEGADESPSGHDDHVTVARPEDLDALAQEAARQRLDGHARRREELTAGLRSARDMQTSAATRRDEAAARARRMGSHLEECDALIEEATEVTTAAEEAARHLDNCQSDLEAARERRAVVVDQREAATRVINDARAQLEELHPAEMDESTLRRRVDETGEELRAAQDAHDEAAERLHAHRAQAQETAELREQIVRERAELEARIEAPLYDPGPIRAALTAFDHDIDPDQVDPAAQGLAREWIELDAELQRTEATLPPAPTEQELASAEHQLGALQNIVAELEATSRHARLDSLARDEIEAAHEAVLVAEEAAGQAWGVPDAPRELETARAAEQEVLGRHGYATYLDLVMAEPEATDAEAELLDALRARRHAEDTVTSLWAATQPPDNVIALRARRDRVYREAAELLCCDPGDRGPELLSAHPVVPPWRTQELAHVLAAYGVYPVGVSVRDAAIDLLLGIEREIATRDQLVHDIERLDVELTALDQQDADQAGEIDELVRSEQSAAARVNAIAEEFEAFDGELRDRMTSAERRLQRVAAAEELRAQIAAVGKALERSDEDYELHIAKAEAAVADAERALEDATAAISQAARKVRRISEALAPPLRPKVGNDPLAELPALHEVLASEAERAEAAVTAANRELERARSTIQETQAELEALVADNPADVVIAADLRAATRDLIGNGEQPVVLDDPFAFLTDDERAETLDELAQAASHRPVVLLTDHAGTLGWAIGLPDDIGAVTGLPVDDLIDEDVESLPSAVITDTPGAVAPSS